MVEIKYTPHLHELDASGHANFAEYGKDIVCAAVTTLLCALGDILTTEDIECTTTINDSGGAFKIKARPKIAQVHDCTIMFKTVCGALKDIAEAYPDNVTYKEIK